MNLPKEEELTGHGISYCATCDGAFYKGQEICLIGDANTAVQYALLLSNYCAKVHVFALFDRLFADQILIDRLNAKDNITVKFNMALKEFLGDKELTGLRFENTKTGSELILDIKGVFIAIGQKADNKRYANLVDLNEKGFINVDSQMKTKTDGLYAVGDCTNKFVRQVQTACSDGATAAFYILKYLN